MILLLNSQHFPGYSCITIHRLLLVHIFLTTTPCLVQQRDLLVPFGGRQENAVPRSAVCPSKSVCQSGDQAAGRGTTRIGVAVHVVLLIGRMVDHQGGGGLLKMNNFK